MKYVTVENIKFKEIFCFFIVNMGVFDYRFEPTIVSKIFHMS